MIGYKALLYFLAGTPAAYLSQMTGTNIGLTQSQNLSLINQCYAYINSRLLFHVIEILR